ncbi:hypothetical protein RKD37_003458 [Streptomyces ambofaciens]
MLPISKTSGGFSSERAVVSFCWMPFHFWISNLTLALVFASKSLARSACQSSGEEPSITHTVSVSPA